MNTTLEIACFSPRAAMVAAQQGCGRLELCSSYREGGLTPSHACIEYVRALSPLPLFVMVRPVASFQCSDEASLAVMRADVLFCKRAGADGVVLGLLADDGAVDARNVAALVKLADPLPVTFHRAFDVCRDPLHALETLIDCGVRRILTSGGMPSAADGAARIAELQRNARGRIVIVPGGGVTDLNAARIIELTGCSEIHSSAKKAGADVLGEVLPDPAMIRGLNAALGRGV